RAAYPELKIEMHLMVEAPERALPLWFDSGADRAVVHWEALSNKWIVERYPDRVIVLGTKVETPVEDLFPYLTPTSSVLILAVPPGYSGQPFDPAVLEKIRMLGERFPGLEIEVDGGINAQTIRLVRGVADIALSASYIFKSPDPRAAFEKLTAA
ncbi:MAG: hypothetical protein AAB601_00300, partial [Patescibacteria group bacterium]